MLVKHFVLANLNEHILSKCAGGHQVLHRGLKLNSKNSGEKYKKAKLTGDG